VKKQGVKTIKYDYAKITFPIHDLITKRWSPSAFSDRPVEKSKLLSILKAA